MSLQLFMLLLDHWGTRFFLLDVGAAGIFGQNLSKRMCIEPMKNRTGGNARISAWHIRRLHLSLL